MNERHTNRPLLRGVLLVALAAVAFSGSVFAQGGQSISVNSVERRGGVVMIKVKFAAPLEKEDQAAATRAENYSVLDTAERRYLTVCSEAACAPKLLFPGGNANKRPNLVLIQVREPIELVAASEEGSAEQATQRYYVQALGLSAKGKPVEQALLAPLPVKPKEEPSTGGGDSGGSKYDTATDRDEANVYVSGEVSRASGTDFTGTADIKIKQPVMYRDFWGTSHEISPLFDLIASNDPKADPDTMKLGVDWLAQVVGTKGRLQGIFWDNDGKFETERDFDNVNLTWGSRLTFAPRPWQDRRAEKVLFYVRPFVGAELGKNLKSPVAEADGGGIARLYVGTTLNLRFPLKSMGKDSALSLEANYERRWPLKREVSFEENDDGTLKAVTFGTNPRDWVDAKFIFKFNKFFGPFVGYQYGEQPPSFKLVDHQFKAGFIISAKRNK
jgi:hypothetical protein